jgi:hypothetical protein
MPVVFDKPQPSLQTSQVLLAGLVRPQQMYVQGLQDISQGSPPTEANFVGWRYLVGITPDLGVASIVSQKPGGAPVYAGLSYGPQAARAVQAAQQLETLSGIPEGTWGVVTWSIPGLLTEAFWLRTAPATNDLVVPYDTGADGLQLMHVYQMSAFLQIIKTQAATRLAFAAAHPRQLMTYYGPRDAQGKIKLND